MRRSDIIDLATPFTYQVAHQNEGSRFTSRSYCVRALDLLLNTSFSTAFARIR